jgi:hypothetical protein
MSNAPYGIRLLVGVAATAIEETLRLPHTILTYPMTLASQLAQLVMKLQQDLADLAIKGDATLESLFPPKDEQPPWATFDEDLEDTAPADTTTRRTEGRFALYTMPESADGGNGSAPAPPTGVPAPAAPAVAAGIDYDGLTLAQLRARVQSLSVGELEDLLAYEEAGKSRAPFQTLLANRIIRASAK